MLLSIDYSTLHRVFSHNLPVGTCWFAVHSSLCCLKPSVFCSGATAQTFPDEYKRLPLKELRDGNGSPAPPKWFNSHHRSDVVYVASAFGLLAGLLRGKNLGRCSFFRSENFQALVEIINQQGFSRPPPVQQHEELNRWKSHIKVLEASLASTAKELLEMRSQMRWNIPSPPTTPSPPKPAPSPPSPPKPKASNGGKQSRKPLFPPKPDLGKGTLRRY